MRTLGMILFACALATADTVVLRDGTILSGAVKKAGQKLSVGGRSVPLPEVLLWENAEGAAQYAPDAAAHARACEVLAGKSIIETCRKLLDTALGGDDTESARKLLARAETAGLDGKQADAWAKKIDARKGAGTASIQIPGNHAIVALLLDRARKQTDDESDRGLYLLREALRLQPKDEAANDLLTEKAPRRWTLGDSRHWLDWKLDVLAGVRLLKRRRSSDIQRAVTFWGRNDLVGLETENMIFITPLRDPGPVTMCLRLSDITCAALDKMFSIKEPKRDEFLPLVVYFYENQQEYIDKSGRGMGRGPSKTLGLTAGHYTPAENVSRFFWPKRASAYRSVRDTFVHELTHHWIERRNPRWHERELAGAGERTMIPGYWVVEGFATFIQHSRFDTKRGTWTHFNSKAHSIDVVASVAKQGKLLDWDMVYTLPQQKFHTDLAATAKNAHCNVDGRWEFRRHGISAIRLFYEQSAATCMYLYFAEGGKYRQQLLEYVTSFYTSRQTGTAIPAAFSMQNKELGGKVAKWCTDVIWNGWRPK